MFLLRALKFIPPSLRVKLTVFLMILALIFAASRNGRPTPTSPFEPAGAVKAPSPNGIKKVMSRAGLPKKPAFLMPRQ
jgi:hypothetical protein